MASLKSEFLYQYQQAHGVPLRSRVFGNVAQLNRIGQPIAGLANAMLAGPGKWAMTALGVHPERSLPRFAAQPFSQWYRQHESQQNGNHPTRGPVLFFHDTFTEHNHPAVGQAAIRVLEAAGYEVILAEKHACCGRPAVSKGMLDEARRMAAQNVVQLAPYAREGIPIVGVEPSCMAMFVGEYRELLAGITPAGERSSLEEPLSIQADAVARVAMPIDRFLVMAQREADLGLAFDGKQRHVLFHGHCQQKAVFGIENTIAMLGMIPGCSVEVIDSSCCGMAGSFGYEREHYDLSLKLAEMSLAPAVRAAPAETIICATGTSCRDQIDHTTSRVALHPIEVLAGALAD
jgi:Fe-S oxidoreductase